MIWGILGAMDEEIALIQKEMTVERTVPFYGGACAVGVIHGQKVNVACCGVGKVNAAACATSMIRELGAGVVLNVGVAGAVGKGLKILDVVLSTEAVYHDFDLTVLDHNYPNVKFFQGDKHLLQLCRTVLDNMDDRDFSYQVGRIATGDQFINDKAVKQDIVDRLSPLCVEMEGAAIAHVAHMNNTPFLIIRAMSDNADEAAEQSFEEVVHVAARHSAQIVLDMLKLAGKS